MSASQKCLEELMRLFRDDVSNYGIERYWSVVTSGKRLHLPYPERRLLRITEMGDRSLASEVAYMLSQSLGRGRFEESEVLNYVGSFCKLCSPEKYHLCQRHDVLLYLPPLVSDIANTVRRRLLARVRRGDTHVVWMAFEVKYHPFSYMA